MYQKTADELYLESSVLWDIKSCSSLKVSRRFGGTCRHHINNKNVIWQCSVTYVARLTFAKNLQYMNIKWGMRNSKECICKLSEMSPFTEQIGSSRNAADLCSMLHRRVILIRHNNLNCIKLNRFEFSRFSWFLAYTKMAFQLRKS
jgi:hypothetical protein